MQRVKSFTIIVSDITSLVFTPLLRLRRRKYTIFLRSRSSEPRTKIEVYIGLRFVKNGEGDDGGNKFVG